jgi:acyl carrier protein
MAEGPLVFVQFWSRIPSNRMWQEKPANTYPEDYGSMERSEIFDKIRDLLVDALAVDDDEVTNEATLIGDLGAESIDILDISFKLEQEFGFKIGQGARAAQAACASL